MGPLSIILFYQCPYQSKTIVKRSKAWVVSYSLMALVLPSVLPSRAEEHITLPHRHFHCWVLVSGWIAEAVCAISEPVFKCLCETPQSYQPWCTKQDGQYSRWHCDRWEGLSPWMAEWLHGGWCTTEPLRPAVEFVWKWTVVFSH